MPAHLRTPTFFGVVGSCRGSRPAEEKDREQGEGASHEPILQLKNEKSRCTSQGVKRIDPIQLGESISTSVR